MSEQTSASQGASQTAGLATGLEVPVRLVARPPVTESGVGTAPPSSTLTGETVKVTFDGREVTTLAGRLIIQAADEAGIYIPRFCYHPRMKPVGMCRMCLVEVAGPRGSSLMPACYNQVSDGMEIHTASPKAKKAQEGVLEFLLVNHPLDCPVCDKGGECPLQDQTLAYGPGESRFVEEKRHWEKPIPISELVYLDRERCIQCGRCVRFADEVAGDPLIDFAERGDLTEVATFPDEPYASYFSGNVVQICPVGALTAKPYRFKARPWDLEQVESTCTSCSFGCRVAVQSSFGEVTRLIGVDSDPVNWGWLCDKGRWVFESAQGQDRLSVPLVRHGDVLVESSWAEALAVAADGIGRAKASGGGSSLAIIGGSRLPNEDAYVWAKAARVAFGTDNVDAQLGDGLPARAVLGLPRASIEEAAAAPLIITLSGDLKDELPVLYLRLRDAVRERGTQIIELTPSVTGLSKYSALTLQYRPGESAALAAAIAGTGEVTGPVAGVDADSINGARAHIARAREIRQSLPGGGPAVVVILGRPSLAEKAEQVAAAARIFAGMDGVTFLPALRRSNVHGALDMGLAPGVLPGRVGLAEGRAWFEHHWKAYLPDTTGLDTAGILEAAAHGRIGGLVLVGADPRVDFPDSNAALRGMTGARFVVAVDTHATESIRRHADVVLPASAWAERRGTFTNIEGRVTWLGQLVTAKGMSWPDWMIASEIASRLGTDLGFLRQEDIWEEITRVSALHRGATYELIENLRSRDGVLVPVGDAPAQRAPRTLDPMADPGIASAELHSISPTSMLLRASAAVSMEPEPNGEAPASRGVGEEQLTQVDDSDEEPPPAEPSGLGLPPVAPPDPASPSASFATTDRAPATGVKGLRLVARRRLWDGGTQVQTVPGLANLHPAPCLHVNPSVLAELGSADGEPVKVTSSRGSLVVPASGDKSVPQGSAVIAWNLPGVRAADLVDGYAPYTEVTISPADGEGGARGGS